MFSNFRAATLCLAIVFSRGVDASEFSGLMGRIPRGANAIMVIDVDATLASPIAVSNGWQGRFSDGSASRPMYLPPEADKVVVAAQLDQVRGFNRIWEVALMGLKAPMPMSLVARAEGGYTDTINGVNVAWVPSDAYFVEIDPGTLGLMAPAERQAISRWVSRAAQAAPMEVPEYLARAATHAGKGPQLVLAIDAADAVQPHRIRERLEQAEFMKAGSLKIDDLVTLIRGLRGMVLKVTFTDKITAAARIDFAAPVQLRDSAAKDLVQNALENMQMELPGTESWKYTVSENSILMDGELSVDTLRRIMSLMEIPTTKFSSLKDVNTEESSGDDMAKNSLAYFKSVDAMLQDLRSKSKSSGSDAYWMDRYASKIDRLPILHVDDDLLNYGQNLSETLRVMSGSRKMTNLQGGAASRGTMAEGSGGYSSGYGYGYYGYSTARSRNRDAGVERQNAVAQGTVTKLQGFTLIDNATVEIRREMTKRYSIEF